VAETLEVEEVVTALGVELVVELELATEVDDAEVDDWVVDVEETVDSDDTLTAAKRSV